MATPARTRLTYQDLEQSLSEGSLYTLIDGDFFMTPAPDLEHQSIVGEIFSAVRAAISDRSRVFVAPIDVVLSQDNVAQPDVVLVLERNRSILQKVIQGVPDLVVEVLSPGTAKRDKSVKKTLYERYVVPEYWIVSPENQSVEVYRINQASRTYALASTFRHGDTVATPLLPSLALDVGLLFAEL